MKYRIRCGGNICEFRRICDALLGRRKFVFTDSRYKSFDEIYKQYGSSLCEWYWITIGGNSVCKRVLGVIYGDHDSYMNDFYPISLEDFLVLDDNESGIVNNDNSYESISRRWEEMRNHYVGDGLMVAQQMPSLNDLPTPIRQMTPSELLMRERMDFQRYQMELDNQRYRQRSMGEPGEVIHREYNGNIWRECWSDGRIVGEISISNDATVPVTYNPTTGERL